MVVCSVSVQDWAKTARNREDWPEYQWVHLLHNHCSLRIMTYTVKAPKSSPSCCPFSQVYLAYSSTLPFLSLVSQSNLQGPVSGVYRQGSEMLLDTRQLNTSGLTGPLYWRLPAQFEGNQVLLSKLMPDTVSLLPLYLQPNRLTDSCCCPHCLNMCFGCLNSHRMI